MSKRKNRFDGEGVMQESVATLNFRQQLSVQVRRLLQRCETRKILPSKAQQHVMFLLEQPEISITYNKTTGGTNFEIKDAVHGRNGSHYSFAGNIIATKDLKVKSPYWISDSINICDKVSDSSAIAEAKHPQRRVGSTQRRGDALLLTPITLP